MTQEDKLRLSDKMAIQMTSQDIDENELKKTIAYYNKIKKFDKFVKYLNAVLNSPFGKRTRKTQSYYKGILDIIEQNLKGLDPKDSLEVLCWTARLMKYYKYKASKTNKDGAKK
jgi:hypothetical protein